MSDDIFVFTAQHRSPSEADLQAAVSEVDGLYIDVNTPPNDLIMDSSIFAHANGILGAFRIDTISYRGGKLDPVADLLKRFYVEVPALANPDSDGIFTIPELVTLLRLSPAGSFHAFADPAKRRT
ncbi:MAG: hypothetical protein AVDCRST_MAG85-2196 [uncultured Solirubrobacteraceae bacterium]|uniref:Uncharacterized protein n=1 Tax=uncultured Solirubrobacteraceae bacterium TaxID=1162706 RepID=A0A6J4SYD4_9ACTN|nr:MAG: hypothetical protein AVDCRST_MAG85-2196 [uncultured Solirubrobacteraceae bacterium]